MSYIVSREALRGEGERILDIMSEAFTPAQWEELLTTALKGAAAKGDRGLAMKLVGAGARIGLALHSAVRGGDGQLVNDLLSRGASGSVRVKDVNGNTPLHLAAEEGDAEIVRSLLLKGADKDARDAEGGTPLYLTAQRGHVAAAKALLEAGADVSIQTDHSALHVAAENGRVDLMRILVENGADLHIGDVVGSTALHVAAGSNQEEAVEVLLEAGADIDAEDMNRRTPLHFAASSAGCEAAQALVKHGANIDVYDYFGGTPLHCAAASVDMLYPLGVAKMVDLLLRSGVDETIVNCDDEIAADVITKDVEGEEESLLEDVKRVRALLANAPADRAWRRRGYLVLCRAHPDRVQLTLSDSQAPTERVERHRHLRDELTTAEEGSRHVSVESNQADERATWEWHSVAAKVLGMEEEGLFRTIVGYL